MKTIADNNNFWPGRFWVFLRAKEAYGYKDVRFMLFHYAMPDEEANNLLVPFGYGPDREDHAFMKSLAEETFSLEEVTQLIDYFSSWEGLTIEVHLADKPEPDYIGVSAVPAGGMSDYYMFDKTENYSLKFAVWGYFDLEGCEKYPIPIDDVEGAFTLDSQDPILTPIFDESGKMIGSDVDYRDGKAPTRLPLD